MRTRSLLRTIRDAAAKFTPAAQPVLTEGVVNAKHFDGTYTVTINGEQKTLRQASDEELKVGMPVIVGLADGGPVIIGSV